MSWQIDKFRDVFLPVYNPSQTHDPMPVESSIFRGPGGYFDYMGAERGIDQLYTLSMTGTYFETEPTYMVDETGEYWVDETGNRVIAGRPADMLRSRLSALRREVGKRGPLWRRVLSDNSRQWTTARLLSVNHEQQMSDRDFRAEITCTFEIFERGWRSENPLVRSVTVPDGGQRFVNVENGGELPIYDVELRLVRTAGTVFAVNVQTTGVALRWVAATTAERMGAGHYLLIHNGTKVVRRMDAVSGAYIDQYANLFRQAAHTVSDWVPLPLGNNIFSIAPSGGNVRADFIYYPRFA